jgi:nucleoporin NDC1
VVRKQGNNPGAAPLKEALQYSSQKFLTDGQKAKLSPTHIQREASGLLVQIVHSPVGYPFRQPFNRRVSAVVFGGGEYSNTSVIINAVDALTALLLASLKEDKYGEVSKSVPTVIRAFASTISAVEVFLSGTDRHWSDIDAKKWAVDVEVLLQALRQGLEGIFGGFGEYLEGLGMGADEVRSCKSQLVSKRSEMEQVGSS